MLIALSTASPTSQTNVGITQGPNGRTTVKEQSPIQMPCVYQLPDSYRQSNSVTLRWRKDGKALRQVELGLASSTTSEPQLETMLREDARLTLNKETGSLHFASVLASDAGVYQCQLLVEGQSAVTSGSGTLEVIEQLKFMPQPTSKNLELGSVSKVHCKAQGTPPPQVKWMRVSVGQGFHQIPSNNPSSRITGNPIAIADKCHRSQWHADISRRLQ